MKRNPERKPTLGLLHDERGLTTVEYIIILCLVAVVGFAVWKSFGDTVKTKVNGATTLINTLPTAPDSTGAP